MEAIEKKNNKSDEELTKEFNELSIHLFYCHYNPESGYKLNREVEELRTKDDEYLRGFRQFLINEEEQANKVGNDPFNFMKKGKDDLDPSSYRADIVNKIDMIIHLRTKVSNDQIARYSKYIEPNQLEEVYEILIGYMKVIDGFYNAQLLTRKDAYAFINSFDEDFIFILQTFIEMIRDSITRKHNGRCDSDYARNHYDEEDIITFYLADIALNYINQAKENKKPGFLRGKRD